LSGLQAGIGFHTIESASPLEPERCEGIRHRWFPSWTITAWQALHMCDQRRVKPARRAPAIRNRRCF